MGRSHGIVLYLPAELVLGLAKIQTEKGLGRSYAGLLALAEGMYQLGAIDKEEYSSLKQKYSVGLKKKRPLTLDDVKRRQEQKELENLFSRVLGEWHSMKPKSRSFYLRKARAHDEVKNARLLLDLVQQEAQNRTSNNGDTLEASQT